MAVVLLLHRLHLLNLLDDFLQLWIILQVTLNILKFFWCTGASLKLNWLIRECPQLAKALNEWIRCVSLQGILVDHLGLLRRNKPLDDVLRKKILVDVNLLLKGILDVVDRWKGVSIVDVFIFQVLMF